MNDDGIRKINKRRKKNASVINIAASGEVFFKKADELSAKGDFIGALKMYRRAAAIETDTDEIKLLIADTLLDMNCFVEAMGEIAPMLVAESVNARHAVFRLAHCLLGRGEFKAARDMFALSVADIKNEDITEPLGFDDAANAYDCMEYCERAMEDDEPEKRALRDVDEISINDTIEEAGELSERGEFENAIELLEEAVEKKPNSIELFTDLLLDNYCARRLDRGKKLFESADGELRDDFTVRCCAAMIYHALGDRQREEECVDAISARELVDTNEIVRAYTVMMELSRYDKAREYADKLAQIDPYNRTFSHFLAHSAFKCGDIKLAKNCYQRNLVIEPHDSVAAYYRDLCSRALEGEEETITQIDYSVPPNEYMKRMERTQDLANLSNEELADAWKSDREEILYLTDWAMNDRSCPFCDLYIVMLTSLEPELAENITRRLLVEPDCSDNMRSLAAARLSAICKSRKFLMFQNGSINVCTFGPSAPQYADWPESYKKIIRLVHAALNDKEPKLFSAAARLCYLYVLDNYKTRPSLPYGQAEAMAAAIVYFVLTHSENSEEIDMAAFAQSQGVTVRRLENALMRLLAVTVPDALGSEDAQTQKQDGENNNE